MASSILQGVAEQCQALRDGSSNSQTTALLLTAALPLLFILLLLGKFLYPTFDPREPPVLYPRVPFIGHIISLVREKSGFYARLYKEKRMPICTLPMLNGKLYVINSPTLISAAMRSRDLSFDPFSIEFAEGALGLTKEHTKLFSQPGFMDEVNKVIHSSMTGDSLKQMMARGLADIAGKLNAIGAKESVEVENSFVWLRDIMSKAVMWALYGEKNPWTEDAIAAIWDYDENVMILAMNMFPSLLAPKAVAARAKAQAVMKPFYVARHYEREDVAAIIRGRAILERDIGISDEDLGRVEFTMPWVAITNTIPTLFWFFSNVFSRPEYLERVREEILDVTTIAEDGKGRRLGRIDITKLEKKPFTTACYQEASRLYNDAVGNRRVMQDTIIKDASGEYLLTKGTNVQWGVGVLHMNPAFWGPGADTFHFEPGRWMEVSAEEERKRRGAMIPFGGGKHLCPGRSFALAENLGLTSALALGYDLEGVQVPGCDPPYMGTAVRRPAWEKQGTSSSIRISRRKGWEDVTWSFAN
ncbi:cytochrome P450 [Diplogelasinospora grovesii]|uniref:Cytochrome P450 n=1 Tax=Diplogelasinospora grovesii TaxID=303347 RepID=A0AAN6MZL3_9PEZI|nr:cytochrome P450 [Diplogelasinospora grovesii]